MNITINYTNSSPGHAVFFFRAQLQMQMKNSTIEKMLCAFAREIHEIGKFVCRYKITPRSKPSDMRINIDPDI